MVRDTSLKEQQRLQAYDLIRDNLDCVICQDICTSPVVGKCGHFVCRSHINRLQRCPVCQEQWIPENMHVVYALNNVVNAVKEHETAIEEKRNKNHLFEEGHKLVKRRRLRQKLARMNTQLDRTPAEWARLIENTLAQQGHMRKFTTYLPGLRDQSFRNPLLQELASIGVVAHVGDNSEQLKLLLPTQRLVDDHLGIGGMTSELDGNASYALQLIPVR
jgi:predicted Zn-ribbon and HTH transcriptional regulator